MALVLTTNVASRATVIAKFVGRPTRLSLYSFILSSRGFSEKSSSRYESFKHWRRARSL